MRLPHSLRLYRLLCSLRRAWRVCLWATSLCYSVTLVRSVWLPHSLSSRGTLDSQRHPLHLQHPQRLRLLIVCVVRWVVSLQRPLLRLRLPDLRHPLHLKHSSKRP